MTDLDMSKKCRNGRSGCGVYYTCGPCRDTMQRQAYARLTPEERAYDDHVDPRFAYHPRYGVGCSCHINPPCSYCMGEEADDDR